ncbi:MAG: hypothetical protein R2772_03655 [Chitinophagales bacterium]
MPQVETDFYEGLTINYCKLKSANYILRGIRSASDFEYEKTIAHLNNAMDEDVETILILSKPELSSISSTIVREIIKGKGEVSKFVPKEVLTSLYDFEIIKLFIILFSLILVFNACNQETNKDTIRRPKEPLMLQIIFLSQLVNVDTLSSKFCW